MNTITILNQNSISTPLEQAFTISKLTQVKKGRKTTYERSEQLNPYSLEEEDLENCLIEVCFHDGYAYNNNGELFKVAYFQNISEMEILLEKNLVETFTKKTHKYDGLEKTIKKFKKIQTQGTVGKFFGQMKRSLSGFFGMTH